ncbi:MAG TPA: hypothetical protein VHA07_07445 [Devosia sp.]|nr:hypothetical protein [Devosia sp.]
MPSTTRLVAALLAVAAALSLSPALAAGLVAGNRGPADKPQSRGATLALPGTAVARPTPRIDASSLGRDAFGSSLDAEIAHLTTVTLSADGTVTQTDPSDALRGIIESAVRGHRSGR